ncbi:MAG: M48 family metalloprotease [Bacteroidales bacterium]|nr:M48 family metalloprotease [Bacteroidales bacterium]MBS3776593.1 M48 family metalloprotease [Bacteroidales bacterium]
MKKSIRILFFILLATGTGIFTSCDNDDGLNIFTLDQDRKFGRAFDNQIKADTNEYIILDENRYSEAYDHLNRIKNNLLESDELNHVEDFDWKARIVMSKKKDTVLNAFAVPGGYMYFYPGLIKYLDNEAEFAGVMAHEMAHVDKRHTTQRMTRLYGFQFLLGLILGENPSQWAKIVGELAIGTGELQFSKSDEYEADEYAVKYSSDTELDPKGVAGFFNKLEEQNSGGYMPEFFSTHPNPGNRVEEIDEVWNKLGQPEGKTFTDRYNEFKNALSK